ncbi:hypothetical protein [Prosthecobacter vanneervenii]|uniref:Uncharacterized protein n=1 Tax=Prosthecobacter vanneervenii TaxID=48466 RepID=A0A7W7Y8Y2_9BACT|nr:hypothetical protein [Prosthecobacter vanneervenii]MBB5031602.1 hypothetical protein [Prosthecobacter vanneervenii]
MMKDRIALKSWATLCLIMACMQLHAAPRALEVVIVVGASGTEEYGKKFQTQVTAWTNACTKASVPAKIIRGEKTTEDLAQTLATADATHSLWLVLIGHGTFDGRDAKFNAEGPDLDVKQLAGWLKPLKQEIAVIHTASSSGGFLKALSGKGRIVITSTKSPDEVFYARFGEHFAEAIGGLPEADLDQDKQVSLLEAFRHASKTVALFYENEGRLATEHALLEDNGDGIGTRSEVLASDTPPATATALDGERAAQLVLVLSPEEQQLTDTQRTTRDALERELKTLKEQRAKMKEDDYYTQLEAILLKLGAVYETKS